MMSTQLPLDLEAHDRFSRDNLVVTPPVRAVLDVLLGPQDWLSPQLYLSGPAGSGKTHLGHVFAAQSGARFLEAEDSFTVDLAKLPASSFVVDNADQASEEALFHLHNHATRTGHPLVLLSRIQPMAWQPKLADLRSRLRAMRLLTLGEPDDALLSAILKKLFAQRFISPSPDALDYIARRMERSVGAAQKIVTDLEHYANGRPFNRLLARDFFDESGTLSFGDDFKQDFDTF